jgi:hypothetical protein
MFTKRQKKTSVWLGPLLSLYGCRVRMLVASHMLDYLMFPAYAFVILILHIFFFSCLCSSFAVQFFVFLFSVSHLQDVLPLYFFCFGLRYNILRSELFHLIFSMDIIMYIIWQLFGY